MSEIARTNSSRHGQSVRLAEVLPFLSDHVHRKTDDPDATLHQIKSLQRRGAGIIRVAFNSGCKERLMALKRFVKYSLPVVADIHFDYKLALEAAKREERSCCAPY